MSDRQAMFKAAKAQRGSGTAPTKEQLKALRAQKAKQTAESELAAKQEAESRRRYEAAKSMAVDQASRLPPRSGPSPMGPPASRPSVGPRPAAAASVGSAPGVVLRRTDSQRTKVGRNQSVAPEPAGQSNASSGAVRPDAQDLAQQSEERSIGSLPNNFFDQPQNSGEHQQASADTAERIGSNAEVHSEVASALGRGSSVEAMSARTNLPQGFFEAAGSTELDPLPPRTDLKSTNSQIGEVVPPKQIPKGFFENKDADARARGLEPARKKTKEEEYKDFMSTIADDVKQAEAQEEADAVQATENKAAQENNEQKIRLERILLLAKGHKELPDARMSLYKETEVPEIDVSKVAQSNQKRPRDEDLPSDDEDLEDDLDWRSKTL